MANYEASTTTDKLSSAAGLIELIGIELRKLSGEIESLPSFGNSQLTNEQIVQLQKIDFCSQKLMDLAAIADQVSNTHSLQNVDPPEDIAEAVKLEYTKALLR